MTPKELRRIVEVSSRFDVRGALVWLREVRWLRAVASLRAEDSAARGSRAGGEDAADDVELRRSPPARMPGKRRAARGG
jgi:hypothetical protein